LPFHEKLNHGICSKKDLLQPQTYPEELAFDSKLTTYAKMSPENTAEDNADFMPVRSACQHFLLRLRTQNLRAEKPGDPHGRVSAKTSEPEACVYPDYLRHLCPPNFPPEDMCGFRAKHFNNIAALIAGTSACGYFVA
jgi:hypothetical protein